MDREKLMKQAGQWIADNECKTIGQCVVCMADFALSVNGWTATEAGLPTEEGDYVVVLRNTGDVVIRWMPVHMPDYCVRYFLAWRPIPAYKPKD
jgi:hypothetical protein